MTDFRTYKPQQFNLSGLNGISDQTLEMHFKLYEGYVTNTNTYTQQIAEMMRSGGTLDPKQMPAYSELTRRLGFEFNGMVLHEWYFGNMKKDGSGDAEQGSEFRRLAEQSFGSYENWKADFTNVGKMRGVGWAVCFQDPVVGGLSNHWITLHEEGNVAGFTPILVMDVWEHAFLLDYKPAERPKYIEAFFSNIDWTACERRLREGSAARPAVTGGAQ
ncbi:MAG TPA: Fe-Mn family superoxide dismutase [Pyrinomonadaceae bacterium]|nr:Fe-Mn family superoxide dismutase [Pyrinomonadaceae bacterium]